MSIKNVEIQTIGLHIGTPDHSKINPISRTYNKAGVFTCPGISIFGDAIAGQKATVTIYPPHIDSKQSNLFSLYVNGDSAFIGDVAVNGNQSITKDLKVTGTTYSTFRGSINVQGWKGFDIKHPTKENHRLRYICLEGPEGGVYHRGRLKGTNRIDLPEYWKNLVHEDSITVQLQPIGHDQNIFVKEFDNEKIIIEANTLHVDCFYHVYGERKDGERLIPEYEGNSPEDYPGKNDQYSIAGYHYDRRTL
tara:strand:+ start:79 stop:825 length:747 start_codon:yes stop_codon:yes gene_type:complete